MPSQTDKLIAGYPLPASVLGLLHIPIESDCNTWKQRFEALIEQLPIMLYTTAPHDLTQIEYSSTQFAEWLGYPKDEWTGTSGMFLSRLHPDDLELVMANDARAASTGQPFEIEYRLRARDGAYHWVRDSAVLLRNEAGEGIAWQGVTIDITDLKEAETRQAEARMLYRSLIEQVPGVVFRESTDLPPRALYVSPQVEDLLGYTAEEWNAAPCIWEVTVHPDDQERVHQEHVDAVLSSGVHVQYRMVTKDGRTIWVREDRELVRDERGRPSCWQGLLIDITRQKELEDQLAHQARHDPLTGLPNRTYFAEIVTRTLEDGAENAEKIAVFFLDLDGFKTTNDSLGHQVGDALLAAVAQHLQIALRDDDVVARIGGDEFAILLKYPIDHDGAAGIARRVMEALRHPVVVSGHEICCSGSIGIAFGTAGEDTLADLLRQADIAMYEAKALGKDQFVVFQPRSSEDPTPPPQERG